MPLRAMRKRKAILALRPEENPRFASLRMARRPRETVAFAFVLRFAVDKRPTATKMPGGIGKLEMFTPESNTSLLLLLLLLTNVGRGPTRLSFLASGISARCCAAGALATTRCFDTGSGGEEGQDKMVGSRHRSSSSKRLDRSRQSTGHACNLAYLATKLATTSIKRAASPLSAHRRASPLKRSSPRDAIPIGAVHTRTGHASGAHLDRARQ